MSRPGWSALRLPRGHIHRRPRTPSHSIGDPSGTIFISAAGPDNRFLPQNNRIRKVDGVTSTIITVAGSGNTPEPGGGGCHPTDIGDGGPAVGACLYHPGGI